jgi:divalent metal cation (Fe/Co/Zn/Cd) transporter
MRARMTDIVQSIDPCLNIHDFRLVSGETHTNLIFDVSVPFRCELSNARIRDEVNRKLKEQIHETYYTVITFDRSFL